MSFTQRTKCLHMTLLAFSFSHAFLILGSGCRRVQRVSLNLFRSHRHGLDSYVKEELATLPLWVGVSSSTHVGVMRVFHHLVV